MFVLIENHTPTDQYKWNMTGAVLTNKQTYFPFNLNSI